MPSFTKTNKENSTTAPMQRVVNPATPTRRQFSGMLGGSVLLGVTGCGGGGSSDAPVLAPKISVSPQSTSATAGQTVVLEVTATGTGLTYSWTRNGAVIPGAASSTLQVMPTIGDDGAQYVAQVSNSAGQVQSAVAVLSVKLPAGISLLAGGLGGAGYLSGRGALARIDRPQSLAVTTDGVAYFGGGSALGKISALGDVSFFSGSVQPSVLNSMDISNSMACNSKGELFVCSFADGVIYKLVDGVFGNFAGHSPSNPDTALLDGLGQAAQLSLPRSPVFDAQDNLYFIDFGNRAIRMVTPAGAVSTLAGKRSNVTSVDGKGSAAGFGAPNKLLVLRDGSLLVLDGAHFRKVSLDGTVTTLPGSVPLVADIVGVELNALYAIVGNSVVKLAPDGTVVTLAGNAQAAGSKDGVGSLAQFNGPSSLALAANGQLLVADTQNHMIRKIDIATGAVSVWAGAAAQAGATDGTGSVARFNAGGASCLDSQGNIYTIDAQSKALRKITPLGVVTTPLTDFPSDGGVAVDASGNFYGVRGASIVKVTPSGVQSVFAGPRLVGFSIGLGEEAEFGKPTALAFDSSGNLYVGDAPVLKRSLVSVQACGILNQCFDEFLLNGNAIWKISPSGVVSTFARTSGQVFTVNPLTPSFSDSEDNFLNPSALSIDSAGRVWVLDSGNIRRIDGPRIKPVWISRGASLAATSMALVGDSSGDLFVATANTVVKLAASGAQTLVAGSPAASSNGVQLGALPASLGTVGPILSNSSNTIYAWSENSLLKIQLA